MTNSTNIRAVDPISGGSTSSTGSANGGSDDGVALLIDQHQTVRSLLDEVERTSGDQRRQAFDMLRALLAVHETAEELVVRPVTRTKVDGGSAIADARMAEENKSKEMLAQLEALDATTEQFGAMFGRFKADVLAHAQHEETEEFPKLRETVGGTELSAMAKALKAAEAVAPTHPHPSAKSTTANLVLGPIAAVVDRTRDAIKAVTG
jgi:hemerythrin superfamily protein